MNLSKSATIIAALAMASVTGLALSQKEADASTVATVTTKGAAPLYTSDGTRISDRALAPNSKWAVGYIFVSGDEAIYQVSTNEYLKSTDATLTGDFAFIQPNQKSHSTSSNTNGYVATVGPSSAALYRDDTNSMSDRALGGYTSWAVGKHYVNKNGEHFYQVSTHEYVNGKSIHLNRMADAGTYVANFGIPGASTSINTNDNNNTSNTNNDSNANNTTNNNNSSNNTTNTTVDTNDNNTSTSTDTNTASYQPNLNNINKYFVQYLNALHKANGTDPVQLSDHLMSYAQGRATQQNGQNLDHSTATESHSENLTSAGFNYMKYAGVKSDKDAAYFLLKDWYDEDNNYYPMGTAGHFGHRAALIYSGPNVGLGITDTDAAFNADWNWSDLSDFNQLYDYTGTTPNTKFISKDAI